MVEGSGTGGEGEGFDLFRAWIEGNRALFGEGAAGPVWVRAETVFRAWARFWDAYGAERASRRTEPGASPFDPAGWLRPEGAGGMADLMRWLEGPAFADLFAEERRAIRGTAAWLAYLTATEQMKTVIGEGWLRAFSAFAERLGEADGAASPVRPPGQLWRRVAALWEEVADREMATVYRSPAYLAAQRDLIAAEVGLRRALRERVETYADLLGLPTRREVDDLHATVDALRREVRRLKRAGAGV